MLSLHPAIAASTLSQNYILCKVLDGVEAALAVVQLLPQSSLKWDMVIVMK